jgi:hypothetical protein
MTARNIRDALRAQRVCPPDGHGISTDKGRRDARRTRGTVAFDADAVALQGHGPGRPSPHDPRPARLHAHAPRPHHRGLRHHRRHPAPRRGGEKDPGSDEGRGGPENAIHALSRRTGRLHCSNARSARRRSPVPASSRDLLAAGATCPSGPRLKAGARMTCRDAVSKRSPPPPSRPRAGTSPSKAERFCQDHRGPGSSPGRGAVEC